jgi:hypothetical protein
MSSVFGAMVVSSVLAFSTQGAVRRAWVFCWGLLTQQNTAARVYKFRAWRGRGELSSPTSVTRPGDSWTYTVGSERLLVNGVLGICSHTLRIA